MQRIVRVLAAAAVVALAGCGQGSGAAALSGPAAGGSTGASARRDTVSTVIGTSFNLRVGQSARVTDANLVVSFLELREDSRCPMGAQCVTAGNAQIVIGTATADGSRIQSTLNLTGNNQFPSRTSAGGFDISFQALAPTPSVNAPITRDQYVASFVVTRP